MNPLSLARLAVTLSLGTIATLALPSAPAAAQSGVIRCESQNNRERVCNTGWRNAQLVRQLSGSACDEGRTWGSRNGSIWVSNGCRAEFVEARGGWGGGNGGGWGGGNGGGWGGNNGRPGETIRCESQNNRERSCPVGWRNARLVRQLSGSPCDEGRTWGCAMARCGSATAAAPNSPKLAAGAAGAVAGAAATATTPSPAAATTTARRTATGCARPAGAAAAAVRQLAEGRSWGYARGQVWVSNGCRRASVRVELRVGVRALRGVRPGSRRGCCVVAPRWRWQVDRLAQVELHAEAATVRRASVRRRTSDPDRSPSPRCYAWKPACRRGGTSPPNRHRPGTAGARRCPAACCRHRTG